jgi:hypothetical protein
MTAIKKYDRLEALGVLKNNKLWPNGEDVIVSLGKSSIIFLDKEENSIAHWSLASLYRANPGEYPAIFQQDEQSVDETIEINVTEGLFISAISQLIDHIEEKHRKKPRLKSLVLPIIAVSLILFTGFLSPVAIRAFAASAVPDDYRHKIINQIHVLNNEDHLVENADKEYLYNVLKENALSLSVFLIFNGRVPKSITDWS